MTEVSVETCFTNFCRFLKLIFKIMSIHFAATHPRYLQDLCRLVIRKALGPEGVKRLNDLPLPQALVMYLNYFHEFRQE